MKNPGSLRTLSFGIALIAVIALTVMNVYSLFELRTNSIEAAQKSQEDNVEQFASELAKSVTQSIKPVKDFYEVGFAQRSFDRYRSFTEKLNDILDDVSVNPLISEIYFSPNDSNHCNDPEMPIYRFNDRSERIDEVSAVNENVCDAISIARNRTISLEHYRDHVVTNDAHESLTVSLVNGWDRDVFGHLTFMIDQDYLVNTHLPQLLNENFGRGNESSLAVWVFDTSTLNRRNSLVAKSDPDTEWDHESMHIQAIPTILTDWVIDAQYIETPVVAASNASLLRNLFVLGTAVFTLFGAMLFMYVTSKRERELAQRQAGFLANITHEFKTPLAAMQAAGENILDGRVSGGPRLKTYGSHIYNETIRLRKMIDQLLDIARIDSGQSMVQAKALKPGDAVREFYDAHRTYITSKGFKLTLHVDDEINLPLVFVDPDHLETIISNLVENAIKYSNDKKEIALNIRQKEDRVELQVRDWGVGIPRKLQKQIFDKFYRVEDSMTARTKGHGLGLSIVKNLTELNGGNIRVNSEPDEGSTFIVSFPVINEGILDDLTQADPDDTLTQHADVDEYDNK